MWTAVSQLCKSQPLWDSSCVDRVESCWYRVPWTTETAGTSLQRVEDWHGHSDWPRSAVWRLLFELVATTWHMLAVGSRGVFPPFDRSCLLSWWVTYNSPHPHRAGQGAGLDADRRLYWVTMLPLADYMSDLTWSSGHTCGNNRCCKSKSTILTVILDIFYMILIDTTTALNQ